MYKQQIKNILAQDRSSFPLRDYPQEEEVMAQQQLINVTQHPAVMELTGAEQEQFAVGDLMMPDQSDDMQYFVNTSVESFAAEEQLATVRVSAEMAEKISELEKSNSSLHSKIDNLTLELQNFKKDFASQFQELKQKLFDAADQTAAKAVEEQQNQPKSPKSVKFAIDEDTNPRKRPSSSDEQQPATKKPAFGDDTVAFSQKFVKGKNTTSKKKNPTNVIQDLILVLVWITKLSRLFCEVFKLQNLFEIEEKTISSNYAYRFARWLNLLKEGLNEEEEKLVQTLAKRISTEDLQKFKTGSSFCNSDKSKQILNTNPALFTDDYDFGKLKLTKISYVSTLLAIFTKHGTTISTLFRALRKTNDDDEYTDLIFRKLHSVVSAVKSVTELRNLACICTCCKIRVVDVFCESCKYMTVCSTCHDKTGYVKCPVCKTKMNKVVYGYNSETPVNSGDKSTSALYSSSVRTIPQIQAATRNFGAKHKMSGLIGKTCESDLKPKDDATKAFASFVNSVENELVKSLGAVETFLKQGGAKGFRLCDACRTTVATKRLRYRPAEGETVIAVCDRCFEEKTDDGPEDTSPFVRFLKDGLYKGANMSLTAAALQLDLSSVPLDSRHRAYLKKANKRINADAVCAKYKIDAQSRSQEDSVLTLKTVLKQIVSWGAEKNHDAKTYFEHINENMALCWPINSGNHLIQVDENENKKEADREVFFNENTINLIQPQSHEKKQDRPHPYVKQILQILKTDGDDNKKIAGLKAVLKESDVCVCDESVIVVGKLFKKLESSKLLSDMEDDDCQIVGFFNGEFHPHPKNLKKRTQRKPTKAREEEEEEDLNLSEGPSSDEEEEQQEQESATDTLTNLLEQV